MNENMEFPDLTGDDIEWLQEAFVDVVLQRREEGIKVGKERTFPPKVIKNVSKFFWKDHRVKKEDKGKASKVKSG